MKPGHSFSGTGKIDGIGSRQKWTANLILNLKGWIDHQHGEVNYLLTQFLSGYGNFNACLHGMRKVPSLACQPVSYTHLDVYKRQIEEKG